MFCCSTVIQVGHGKYEVIRRQGFPLNKVEIRTKQHPIIQI